jgi:putative ubiquitin-RnfH superfamily antitoxin RatB of RatAB toxin-antitoxin module
MTNKLTMTNEALTKEAVLTQQLTEENLNLKSEVEVYNKKLKELTKENDRVNFATKLLLY